MTTALVVAGHGSHISPQTAGIVWQNVDALRRLAGKVAHDFNGLLALVKGYSELALDLLEQDDPLRNYIEQIHRANERANSLTRQLVAFTRTQVAAPEILDVNKMVAEMEGIVRRLIGESIELVIKMLADAILAGKNQAVVQSQQAAEGADN